MALFLAGMTSYFSLFIWFLCLMLPVLWLVSKRFRFQLKMAFVYFILSLSAAISFVLSLKDPFHPLNYRNVCWALQLLDGVFNIKWELRNVHRLKRDRPYVIVCNHQSSLDLFGMVRLWPDYCVCLVKRSLMYAGPFGLSAYICGTIFVDRFDKNKSKTVIKSATSRVADEKLILWVFPEGTRNHKGSMLPFKKGGFHVAVESQIPIVPIVFSSFKHFCDGKEAKFDNSGFVIAEVLPEINTAGLNESHINDLSIDCREEMLIVFDKISKEAAERYENNDF